MTWYHHEIIKIGRSILVHFACKFQTWLLLSTFYNSYLHNLTRCKSLKPILGRQDDTKSRFQFLNQSNGLPRKDLVRHYNSTKMCILKVDVERLKTFIFNLLNDNINGHYPNGMAMLIRRWPAKIGCIYIGTVTRLKFYFPHILFWYFPRNFVWQI